MSYWGLMRQLCQGSGWLLQYGLRVAINLNEKHKKSWNETQNRLNFATEIRNDIDL